MSAKETITAFGQYILIVSAKVSNIFRFLHILMSKAKRKSKYLYIVTFALKISEKKAHTKGREQERLLTPIFPILVSNLYYRRYTYQGISILTN